MNVPKVFVALVATGLLVGGSVASAAPTSSQQIDDDAEECLEAVPEQTSIASVTDDGREVTLEVYTLLDGVDLYHGQLDRKSHV